MNGLAELAKMSSLWRNHPTKISSPIPFHESGSTKPTKTFITLDLFGFVGYRLSHALCCWITNAWVSPLLMVLPSQRPIKTLKQASNVFRTFGMKPAGESSYLASAWLILSNPKSLKTLKRIIPFTTGLPYILTMVLNHKHDLRDDQYDLHSWW